MMSFLYSSYYAFLPDWPPPHAAPWDTPYTPDTVPASLRETHSPRAVLMARLVVSTASEYYHNVTQLNEPQITWSFLLVTRFTMIFALY
jgi:hypothetical protein